MQVLAVTQSEASNKKNYNWAQLESMGFLWVRFVEGKNSRPSWDTFGENKILSSASVYPARREGGSRVEEGRRENKCSPPMAVSQVGIGLPLTLNELPVLVPLLRIPDLGRARPARCRRERERENGCVLKSPLEQQITWPCYFFRFPFATNPKNGTQQNSLPEFADI